MSGKRILAFLIDFVITCIIQAILMFGFIIIPIVTRSDSGDIFLKTLLVTYLSSIYLIFRDVFGKESIGKKIFKLKIVDQRQSGKVINAGRRILRNIPFIFGPIEIIVFLANKGKRLGDIISNTSVSSSSDR